MIAFARRILRAKALIICMLTLGLALAAVSAAGAHSTLVRSEPADNSVLDESPGEVRLWFSEPIVPGLSTIRVFDINSSLVTPLSVGFDPGDPTLMTAALPPLDPSVYTVNWNTTSAADGHISRGTIVFGIGGEALPAGASQAGRSAERVSLALEAAMRGLIYLGLIILVGCIGDLLFILRTGSQPAEAGDTARTLRLGARIRVIKLCIVAVLATLLLGFAQLAWQVGSTAGGFSSLSGLSQIAGQTLFGTQWGNAWIARLCLLGLLAWILIRYRSADNSGRFVPYLLALLGIGVLVTQSTVSHAASGSIASLPVLVNFLHLIFAGLWIGGLIALAVGLLPLLLQDKSAFKENVRLCWGPFSRVAAVSVVGVVATGIYSTGVEVVSADALLISPYGRLLTLKIVLVALIGLIGLSNSALLHPGLAASPARWLRKPAGWAPFGLARFPRLVLIECALGIVIALIVGIMTALPPARNPVFTISPDIQQLEQFKPVDDLFITFSAAPNRPGTNLIDIKVINSRRPPPAEVARVIVRSTYLEQDLGTQAQDAVLQGTDGSLAIYRLSQNTLTQPGRWRIEIAVRRLGLPDAVMSVDWTVLPLGDIPPMVLSRYAWGGSLQAAALIFVVLVAFVSGIVLLDRSHQGSND